MSGIPVAANCAPTGYPCLPMRANDAWPALHRVALGLFWLYFASQKWTGVGWMQSFVQRMPGVNPVPGLHEVLAQVVAPNWHLFAVAEAIGETLVGACLILGLAVRKAAGLGFLMAVMLALTVGFLYEPGLRWLYYLAVLVNAEQLVAGPGLLALERARFVPAWLKS